MRAVDAAGNVHPRADSNARIVSLVPSITELLFSLGLGERVVGRTGFCIHPRDAVRDVPKVGGTKDVKLEVLRELHPTHVILNVDENDLVTYQKVQEFVPHVIVTHPNGPVDNIALFRLLGDVFGAEARAEQLTGELEHELTACQAAAWNAERVLYLIWKDPWMAVASDTYIARTLASIGWNVTIEAGGWSGAARYPVISDIEAASQAVNRVLLSSEPFMFGQRHVDQLRDRLTARVDLIDGEMASWYGSRAIRGLAYLREFRAARSAST
ncbi:MAG TPA: helical backbone metal receptor [Burkholderiaceae bacterium]|nr:helical backbone metal receptor [Burkholderiaceae bacterium]